MNPRIGEFNEKDLLARICWSITTRFIWIWLDLNLIWSKFDLNFIWYRMSKLIINLLEYFCSNTFVESRDLHGFLFRIQFVLSNFSLNLGFFHILTLENPGLDTAKAVKSKYCRKSLNYRCKNQGMTFAYKIVKTRRNFNERLKNSYPTRFCGIKHNFATTWKVKASWEFNSAFIFNNLWFKRSE